MGAGKYPSRRRLDQQRMYMQSRQDLGMTPPSAILISSQNGNSIDRANENFGGR